MTASNIPSVFPIAATQQAAKAETAEQAEGEQANVLPPFAAPASQQEASERALFEKWAADQYENLGGEFAGPGQIGWWYWSDETAGAWEGWLGRAELASRGRAQGGITSEENISNLAPTTSTVSASDGWISVDEHLPDDDCRVLAATWRTMTGEQHIDIVSFRRGSGQFSEHPVTHWMPLPNLRTTSPNKGEAA
jgi:hypothetical protein